MMFLAVFVSLFFYSLLSRRLERTVLTAPIVFTVAGMLAFPALPGILTVGFNVSVLFRLAEIGLVLLLFTDASRTDLNVLRSIGNLSMRLLSTGMLLTILLGAVAARLPLLCLVISEIWSARACSSRLLSLAGRCRSDSRKPVSTALSLRRDGDKCSTSPYRTTAKGVAVLVRRCRSG